MYMIVDLFCKRWMSCHDGRDSEEFFDSAECLSVEESNPCGVAADSSEYAVWLSEPQSVELRRKLFLLTMGLGEWGSPVSSSSDDGDLTRIPGIERATETSKAVPSLSNCVEDDHDHSRSEAESCGNFIIKDRDVHSQSALGSISETDLSADSAMKPQKRRNEFSLWKSLLSKINNKRSVVKPRAPLLDTRKIPAFSRVKSHHSKKRLLELSALFSGQDIQAHDGIIRTMKFSPDGQYLATGGEDGIVCIWRVMSTDASLEASLYHKGKSIDRAYVPQPGRIFWIDESPVHVLRSHTGDILDLSWSFSNRLLSSSMDNTVRLWQVGHDLCLGVFHHTNYVTCIQFNPVDDDYFISGSIDGKARVWSVSTRRVVDWADVRDAISAICYRPHGKGFAVGTIVGACHLYEMTEAQMQRDATISTQTRRKRNSSNKITSIQFSKDTSERVLISSQDSKLHFYDRNDMIYKCKGPGKVGSLTSASFWSTKKHMVSIGEDSHVYLRNQSNQSTRSMLSCEYFFSDGASVAVPWSGNCMPAVKANSIIGHNHCRKELHERFSLGKWFSQDSKCRTWPEELLDEDHARLRGTGPLLGTWGHVFVTGSQDGRIRSFQNYGLPVRLLSRCPNRDKG